MDAQQKADLGLDVLDALADKWAVDVDLTSMIKNVTCPMDLNKNAPENVREHFRGRMESQIYAIVRQAWVEGALRGVDLVNDELKKKRLED